MPSSFSICRSGRADRLRFELLARNYRAIAEQVSNEVAALSDAQIEVLGDDYNTPIHLRAAPEVAGRAVNERADRAALAAQFNGARGDPGRRSAHAAGARRYCSGSCWRARSGTTSPISTASSRPISKTAWPARCCCRSPTSCGARFPTFSASIALTQAWAFKGLQAQAAVDVHADDAAVSVNFWVTPTQANLDPGRGGLVVCRAPPPDDWEIKDYDADQARIVTFLEQKADDSLVVPYRQNRAVLFRSRLFHHSDRPEIRLRL